MHPQSVLGSEFCTTINLPTFEDSHTVAERSCRTAALCEFFAQGTEGYKPCFVSWQWKPANSWSTAFARYWYCESRECILDNLDTLRHSLAKEENPTRQFLCLLEKAILGIRSLRTTYREDKYFCAQIEAIAKELDEYHTKALVAMIQHY